MPRPRLFPSILAALLFWAPSARAATVLVTKGSLRRPLFTELYRQSVLAEARYARGFDAIDEALTPNAKAPLVVAFFDEGQILRISLRLNDKQLAFAHVPYPPARWEVLKDVDGARKLAEGLLAKVPGAKPEPARVGTDMARAQLGFQTFDLPALAWTVNTLGAAQRGKSADPAALKLMSASYGWMGHWLNGFPTNHAKLFHARALALAALAGRLSGDASPELALALAHAGRQVDALFILSRSTPTGSEVEAVADALARQDTAKAQSQVKTSRQWLWTFAFASMYNQRDEEEAAAYGELLKDPSDFPAVHMHYTVSSTEARGPLTQAYVELPEALAAGGDFLNGRRPGAPVSPPAGAAPSNWKNLIDASLDTVHDDPGEEIPRSARAGLLLDAVVDAVTLRMGHIGIKEKEELRNRAFGLASAHPWGFLPQLVARTKASEADQKAMADSMAQAQLCFGGLLSLYQHFHNDESWNTFDWLAPREGELDDVSLDTGFRSRIKDGPVGPERGPELDPYSSEPYMTGDDKQLDSGLARLGERPPLLRRKLELILKKHPLDQAAAGAAAARVLAVLPVDYNARYTKASLLMLAGKPLEAASVWREVIARDPASQAATYAATEMSWDYAVAGDFRRSRGLALAAAASGSRPALFALARAYEDSGRYDMAERVYATIEFRDGGHRGGALLARFYLRTGDLRGKGLIEGVLPRFQAMRSSRRDIEEAEYHRLLDAFLITEDWVGAYDLLNETIIYNFSPNDPRLLLWLTVTWYKAGQKRAEGLAILEKARALLSPEDPMTQIVDVFLDKKTPDEALKDLSLDPETRGVQLFMLGEYFTHLDFRPERAEALFSSVVALRQYDDIEYFMALKALGKIPTYPQRVLRQLSATAADLAWTGSRISRWRSGPTAKKPDGRK